MSSERIIIASSRKWHKARIEKLIDELSVSVTFVSNMRELENALSGQSGIRYIFFLHWSSIVRKQITEEFECVCFHMTDLPYGRGGSPLQNLIELGHRETKLSALRMISELDAGPIYLKRTLSLEGSTAEEIYMRAGAISCEMIKQIFENNIQPIEQNGEVVNFKRRIPDQSLLPVNTTLQAIHDHIRMLDADGYPHAFLEIGELRLEFTQSSLYDGKLLAHVKIHKKIK